VAYRVEQRIVDKQFGTHLRVQQAETGDGIGQPHAAETRWRLDAQRPGQLRPRSRLRHVRHHARRFLRLADGGHAWRQVGAARIRQAHFPRGAVQQARVEAFFQLHDGLADHGARQAQALPGRREAAQARHLDKDFHRF